MQLPDITPKQQEILKLLYRYRFLERKQVQSFLGHKDKRRIGAWLKELRDKEYIGWIYDADNPVTVSTPAIYFLALNGIRYLRQAAEYPTEELKTRYKDSNRTQVFIDRCLLVANCCLALRSKHSDELHYAWVLPADYANPDNTYHLLNELKPHLCFLKQDHEQTTGYLLEALAPLLPRYAIRKRIKDYVAYLTSDAWQAEAVYDDPPVILMACPTVADLIYVKRRAKQELEGNDVDEGTASRIRFATVEKLEQLGVTARIWEEV